MTNMAEYIWLDGTQPTQELRSKTRLVKVADQNHVTTESFPEWSYDGSSTSQATGEDSDLTLKPVYVTNDPIRGHGNYLVLCEVCNPDGTPHATNTRAMLRRVMEAGGAASQPWLGYEQEFTLFSGQTPLGWPENGYPKPQGPFYCGVGSDKVFGREIVEAHTEACIDANLMIYGTNAEVMPGQWEFQVGYRGFEGDSTDTLAFTDHMWVARWLLHRIAEDFGVTVSFDNKPVRGDWNGAGMHTNFSTAEMRNPDTGLQTINTAIERLKEKHREHISVYGAGLSERLTGEHETCSINEFRAGVSDRGASIRIPRHVEKKRSGYIEDRRPGANADPYIVAARLITTVSGLDEALLINEQKQNKFSAATL